MVGALWPETHARPVIQPKPPLFLLLLRDFQPFTTPDALDPLMVHTSTRVVQQTGYHAISIAAVLISQFDDIISQALLIGPAFRHLVLCGSMLSKRVTGSTFRHAKLLPHVVDAFPATRRAQKFPFSASARMSLSSVTSDAARRSRWFSFSSSFNRASCGRRIPP